MNNYITPEFKDSPYKKIPNELLNEYTMNGKIPVHVIKLMLKKEKI